MGTTSRPSPVASVFALKAHAQELQDQARAAGSQLNRGAALDQVAKRHGYQDWNAAIAAAKTSAKDATPAPGGGGVEPPLWEDIDSTLAKLPVLFRFGRDPHGYDAAREVMRWAEQLEMIADKVPEGDRRDMLGLIGGDLPHVFVRDPGRWPDGLYHLCDRGYDPFPGVAFTREQLVEVGAIAWHDASGGWHSGDDMIAVVHDDVRLSRDRVTLKRLARLLAAIAREAHLQYAAARKAE